MTRSSRRFAASALTLICGCEAEVDDLHDDPARFVDDLDYRRAILERDLVNHDNRYSQRRLAVYAIEGSNWETKQEGETPSLPLTAEAAQAIYAGTYEPDFTQAQTVEPASAPDTRDKWIALGRRVLFELPVLSDPALSQATREGRLHEFGFEFAEGAWVGLRVVEKDGQPAIAITCAACHSSTATGELDAVLSNRALDIASLSLSAAHPDGLADGLDNDHGPSGPLQPPGHSDPQNDGIANAYAFPDFGGLGDMPYLHHNATWSFGGIATLAIRVETTFPTNGERRIPRVLAWALAEFIASRPAPQPLSEPDESSARGQSLFESQGCAGCHVPPLFTSDRMVGVEEIGTDPLAGTSPERTTGSYRIPSLRGVGRTAPYLHHGAFSTLEEMFEPGRQDVEPGHEFGLQLSTQERADLLAFLRSI